VFKAWRERSVAWAALVLISALILAVLAFLQYRWISDLSVADLERSQVSLETAVGQFVQEFYTELQHVCLVFRPEPGLVQQREWEYFVDRYGDWTRTARNPQLVAGLFIWDAASVGGPGLLQLDQEKMRLEPVDWPARMRPLIPRAEAAAKEERRFNQGNSRLFAWTINERVPALLRSLVRFTPASSAGEGAAPHVVGYLIIELRREYLRGQFLRELVARHFGGRGGLAYRVEITDPGSVDGYLYRSDTAQPPLTREKAEVSVRLVGPALPELARLSVAAESSLTPPLGQNIRPQAPRGASLVLPDETEQGWVLLVEPKRGSLASIAASLKRRNLVLSLGVLLLLAISMGLVILFTQRSQRLARLQLNFVAGVSHELRTPLAVICSAADNLADGVIDASASVKEYGQLIRNEGRRLGTMVEQILRFSAGPGTRREIHPVSVSEVIDAALAEAASSIDSAGFMVERKVDPELPRALTDKEALRQCLQNLISNALRYGSGGQWMCVRAMVATEAAGPEIQVSVEDRGPGIPPGELSQIFEPFFRGEFARSMQTHGTGLGLSLTRQIIEAIGGKVTVASTPGRGSAFTLHLPIAWP
jgi:two-component system, OmpR family, sensor histidine kinase SenX3